MTVGLGLDARGLDDDDDIFREMRVAMSLHRGPVLGSPSLSPRQALHLATSGGARLLGKETSLGRLAPGYAADLVLLDTRRLSWPWVAPEADPRDLLVLRAQARDVQTVLIAGEVVLRDGRRPASTWRRSAGRWPSGWRPPRSPPRCSSAWSSSASTWRRSIAPGTSPLWTRTWPTTPGPVPADLQMPGSPSPRRRGAGG